MTPPMHAIAHAIDIARRSPCAKSRRGAAIYLADSGLVVASACNGPPFGVGCDGSKECRATCRDRCLHAEARAIDLALLGASGATMELAHPHARFLEGTDLVHAKIDQGGVLVAGGGPSCIRCAVDILDKGIDGVWLYEQIDLMAARPDERESLARWRRYTASEFHRVTCENTGTHP